MVGKWISKSQTKTTGETTATKEPTWEATFVKEAIEDTFPQWLKAKKKKIQNTVLFWAEISENQDQF